VEQQKDEEHNVKMGTWLPIMGKSLLGFDLLAPQQKVGRFALVVVEVLYFTY